MLKLKEGVETTCQLTIIPEGASQEGIEAVVAPIPVEGAEASTEEETDTSKE